MSNLVKIFLCSILSYLHQTTLVLYYESAIKGPKFSGVWIISIHNKHFFDRLPVNIISIYIWIITVLNCNITYNTMLLIMGIIRNNTFKYIHILRPLLNVLTQRQFWLKHTFFPVLKIMPATCGNFLTHHWLRLVEVVTENAMALTYIKCGSTTYIIIRTNNRIKKKSYVNTFLLRKDQICIQGSLQWPIMIYIGYIRFHSSFNCSVTSIILKCDYTFIKLSFSPRKTPQNTYIYKVKWRHCATIWKQKRSKNINICKYFSFG